MLNINGVICKSVYKMDDFNCFEGFPYSEEGTRVLTADDLSLPSSHLQPYIAPKGLRRKGRKASDVTNILRLFCKTSTTRAGQSKSVPPKLEYVRAFFNRFERKLVRTVITNKSPNSLKKNLAYNLPGFKACCDFIKQNIKLFRSLKLTDNANDPVSERNKHSSFNEEFTKEFYSLAPLRELHKLLIQTIFTQSLDLDSETFENQIEEFLKMTTCNIDSSKHESLRRLQCLLLSESFTVNAADDDLHSLLASITFICEVPRRAVEAPAVHQPRVNTIMLEYEGLEQIGSSSGIRVVHAFGI